jgi:hypothetical protein
MRVSGSDRARLRIGPVLGHDQRSAVGAGGHEVWWTVEAASEEEAVRLLPFYVAERTTATSVSEVEIP